MYYEYRLIVLKVFLVTLWSKLATQTQESEIIGKWFAGIYAVGIKV